MQVDPFTPTFGVTPPVLAGRQSQIELFEAALRRGVGAAERALLVSGARGTGKTVLLNALEDVARALGWTVISTTNGPGMVYELTNVLIPQELARLEGEDRSRITQASVSVLGVGAGVSRSVTQRHEVGVSLRSQLTALCGAVPEGTGVFLTIDEVHRQQVDQLREVGQAIQHGFREELPLAWAAAGLSSAVSDLLQDKVSTFLRRAERIDLGVLPRSETARAIREPIEEAGRSIGPEALAAATEASDGYPFMIQLIGSHSWGAEPDNPEVTLEAVRTGTRLAAQRVGRLVLAPALESLSAVDRDVLVAMAMDDGPSRVRDVAQRLDRSVDYIGKYRARLADADLVHSTGYGVMDFSNPYLRGYIRNLVIEGLMTPGFELVDMPAGRLPGSAPPRELER